MENVALMVFAYAMSPPDQPVSEASLAAAIADSVASPQDADCQFRLGELSARLGKHEDAVRGFAKAAQLRPDWAPPCFGLAKALSILRQNDAAITAYRSALAIDESDATAHFEVARLLEARGNASEAVNHYEAAARHAPNWQDPYLYRGALHEARGEYDESAAAYDLGLKHGAPAGFALRRDLQMPIVAQSTKQYADARTSFVATLDRYVGDPPQIKDPIREAGGNRFFMAYHGLDDRPIQEKMAKLFRTACPPLCWQAPHCFAERPVKTPRRIGVASRFLHDHSIGRLMIGLLSNLHRRDDCRVHLFHAVAPNDDELRREIESLADDIAILPGDLEESRHLISNAELDVLFYPDIGMDPVTYFLAQARLAPVQCATWGHPVTTGMPSIDYYLSCDAAEPKGAEDHYTEELVRLGGLPFSYRRPAKPNPVGRRADYGLREDATIYFLAQNLFKIHPDMDKPLARILREDPTGVILLLEGQDRNWGETLRHRFRTSIGAQTDRIVFLPRQSHLDYMRLLALSDVSLDSFPFCGGNTTYQSLAMDTPVVTLPGDYLRGRLSLAIYKHLDVMDCIAENEEAYATIALRLGTDKDFRTSLEKRIAANLGYIFDDPIFLRDAVNFLMTAQPRTP